MTTPVYSWDNPPWMPTDLTIRVRDYVTREFQAGVEGNRDRLPSTYDVAKACVRGSGNAASCRRAARHLRLLELVGEIIQVKDDDMSPNSWTYVFWALPNSGRQIPTAVTVSGSAEEQWQIDLGHDIDAAELAPSTW